MSRLTLPTHTYPALLPNIRTGLLIHTSHYAYTGSRRGSIPACVHADDIALLQFGSMYMRSSPVLVQLIQPTLKARSAHLRPPPYSIRFRDVAHYPSILPNRTMAICRDTPYLYIHIPHSYQIFVLSYYF